MTRVDPGDHWVLSELWKLLVHAARKSTCPGLMDGTFIESWSLFLNKLSAAPRPTQGLIASAIISVLAS